MCRLRLITVFLLSFASICLAQHNHFEYLTTKDGLSDHSVNAFYEDEFSRMWVGTRNGLNCYDGNSFRVWNVHEGLNDTYIRNVVGDKNGNLLIQTRTSIFRMDLQTERISPIRQNNDVISIAGNSNGLWMVSADTLFAIEMGDTILFRPVLSAKAITTILALDKSRLWVASSEGVRLYEGGRPSMYFAHVKHVSQLYMDKRHDLWICTRDSGLYQYSHTGLITHYAHEADDQNSLTDNDVRCITEDKAGTYWIGLYGGLCHLNTQTGQVTRYEYDPRAEHALSTFAILSLATDSQGTIWIGSFFGGVYLINPQYSPYMYLGAFGREGSRLSNPIATSACADNAGNLWIGTNGGGVNCLNRLTNHIDYYNLNADNPQYAVKSMWFDPTYERLWIGTHRGGLRWLNTRAPHEPYHTIPLPENNIRHILPMGDSIAVLTQHNLYAVSRQTGRHRPIVPQEIMPVITGELSDMVIHDGFVWFARANSLYAYPYGKTNDGEVIQYELPANAVTLFADSLAGLLIGTDSYGVIRKEDSVFVPVTVINEALTSSYIMDIEACDSSYVFATYHGLYISDKALTRCRPLFSSDKYPIEANVEHSCAIIGSEACIGGVNGMIIFPLGDTIQYLTPISLRLSQVQIDNLFVPNPSLLHSDITLHPDNRTLSFVLTATGAITRDDYRIRFRMKGYEKDWTEANNNARLTYTNLPSGMYTLEMECIDTGLANAVRVRVLPHWYNSWWAWMIYVLVGAGVLVYGIISFAKFIARRTARQLSDANQQDLQKATTIVMNHLADSGFNVERFAREMLLSRTGLFTRMQQIAGQTPNDFIIGIRMREAANMLRAKPELSILDISVLTGFNSCSYFTKCFHHHYGMSPSVWRKKTN